MIERRQYFPAKDSVLDHGEPSPQSSIRRRTRVDMMCSKLGVSMLSPPKDQGQGSAFGKLRFPALGRQSEEDTADPRLRSGSKCSAESSEHVSAMVFGPQAASLCWQAKASLECCMIA